MSTEPKAKRGTLRLTQLTLSDEFQVRRRLDPPTISRYENALKSGASLPPVTVAKVDGVFILVDGYHRVAARERLGEMVLEAKVIETTREGALGMAATANLSHGLPLKNSEIREVFRMYIRARKHIVGRGKLKSYREIGQEIGKPKSTIHNWMRKDFPRIAQRYGGNEEFSGDGGLQEMDTWSSPALKTGLEKIREFREAYRSITCPEAKQELAKAFTETARDLLGDGWKEVTEDF
ncbi:hypothetical protein GLV89_09850 [Halomonas alkaliantarctica]|nr:hypothetical protein [Halomonas alkaliantarctica]